MSITPEIRAQVARLLGRAPRGLEQVMLMRPDGSPMVIRVASLVDDRPFPTLFWLVDPALSYRIDQAEAGGLINRFQQCIDADSQLQSRLREDHRAHIRLREQYIDPALRERICALDFGSVLDSRGIGGIADFSRIRCLHTWYAAHLVVANTVGDMLDGYWRQQP